MATITHVFPGGNTSVGFYSFYNFLPPQDPQRIFTLKGGPGVGKSTFMKKIGEALLAEGYDIEHHHCSSDNNSLDGVVCDKLGVALIDGTAPHIVDPKHPGAIDEILDLGAFWNLKSMEANKQGILRSTREVSRLFKRAYAYLGAAKHLMDDLVALHEKNMNKDFTTNNVHRLMDSLFDSPHVYRNGYARHLFGSAYTPNGHINYTESQLQNMEHVYLIEGSPGTGTSTFLKTIADRAIAYGYDVTYYHEPLLPARLETVVIHGLKVGLTTRSILGYGYKGHFTLDDGLNQQGMKVLKYEIEESRYYLNNLLELAMKNVRMAKLEHDVLETYYVPNMDFDAQHRKVDEILQRVLSYT